MTPTFVRLRVVEAGAARELRLDGVWEPRKTYDYLVSINQIEGITDLADGTCEVLLQSKHKGFATIIVEHTGDELVKGLGATILN